MGEILDIGCGKAKTPGAVGIDVRSWPGVDIVHDLNCLPWPLAADRFDTVVCSHVLEHLTNVAAVMDEIHRVSKRGARVMIITPHFSSLNSWEDPTHAHHFARRSFSFFDTQSEHCCTQRRMKLIWAELSFGGGLWDLIGRLQYRCFPNLWEKHLSFIWRARNLTVELEVVKEAAPDQG
ncbi:MAG: class I SAM-dependent methyltransferase [Planctomycetota bacterium]|nr:class I SAM-dependent methyltransferase [Planctomycetota bacterium]